MSNSPLIATLDQVLGAIPGETVAMRWREQRAAVMAQPQEPLDPAIANQLRSLDIGSLYSHQAGAYDAVARGDDIVVTCSTDSGKSLCYALPTLKALLDEPAARALYLFPTKALAQDQMRKLRVLLPRAFQVSTYDGDTPERERARIRNRAHIVLSNPDMLHVG
ncbi:MAG: DEAD/DEAH box helicase, partial [Armatimonadota bacterium]